MIIGVGLLKFTTPVERWPETCFAANFVHTGMPAGGTLNVSFPLCAVRAISHLLCCVFAGAFLSEIILTMFLLLVILAATDSGKSNQVRSGYPASIHCALLIPLFSADPCASGHRCLRHVLPPDVAAHYGHVAEPDPLVRLCRYRLERQGLRVRLGLALGVLGKQLACRTLAGIPC
jgi:hypothetical protein